MHRRVGLVARRRLRDCAAQTDGFGPDEAADSLLAADKPARTMTAFEALAMLEEASICCSEQSTAC